MEATGSLSTAQRSRVLAHAVSQLFQHPGRPRLAARVPRSGKTGLPKLARETRGRVRRNGTWPHTLPLRGWRENRATEHIWDQEERLRSAGLARAHRGGKQRPSPRRVRRPQAAQRDRRTRGSDPALRLKGLGIPKNRGPRPGRL